ncbi:hypothetical protein ACG2LH_06190 [Zhouia sp. PK063]|uniref:hypothetical protein n=1 Tax=Zhouia sp. PK063 TaxID=3373602 RepID=UPI0037BA580A
MLNNTGELEYREILKRAFPKNLQSDVCKVLNILPLKSGSAPNYNSNNNVYSATNIIHKTIFNVELEGETLSIPYRIYFNEPHPELEKHLTPQQKSILSCIYLRHHDGYLREKRLRLISKYSEKWTTPFIFSLLGEYIYELFPIIDERLNEHTLKFYVEFKNENVTYWQQTESRMISYWNEYYRSQFPKLKSYLGYQILNRINKKSQSKQYAENTFHKRLKLLKQNAYVKRMVATKKELDYYQKIHNAFIGRKIVDVYYEELDWPGNENEYWEYSATIHSVDINVNFKLDNDQLIRIKWDNEFYAYGIGFDMITNREETEGLKIISLKEHRNWKSLINKTITEIVVLWDGNGNTIKLPLSWQIEFNNEKLWIATLEIYENEENNYYWANHLTVLFTHKDQEKYELVKKASLKVYTTKIKV